MWRRGALHGIQRDMINEQAVRILLECILVTFACDILVYIYCHANNEMKGLL